ncbi:MAG: hypothetical protein GC206_08810 [Alphaproteobacteria bacterium]|nr:hypothetical protein [Alphaproteobacteria bacterium]
MRKFATAAAGALAAALLVAGAVTGGAAAQTGRGFSDGQGRLSFTYPNSGWDANDPREPQAGMLYVQTSTGSDLCHIFSIQRDTLADRSVADVRRAFATPIAASGWEALAADAGRRAGSSETPTVVETRVDESGFWPVQRAQFQVGGLAIYAALQGRPGIEIQSFCHVWPELAGEEQPNVAAYDRLIGSIATGRDAEWRASFDAAASATPAQPEAQ